MYLLIRYKCLFPVALSCFSGVSESLEICPLIHEIWSGPRVVHT